MNRIENSMFMVISRWQHDRLKSCWVNFDGQNYGQYCDDYGGFTMRFPINRTDSRLRSLSRCTLTAGRKQNPQKVESTPRHMITKQRRRKYSLIMGVLFAIHQKPNKTEAEQMRTFCPIVSAFPSVTTAAADPHTKRKPPTAFYFSPHSIAKGRLF